MQFIKIIVDLFLPISKCKVGYYIFFLSLFCDVVLDGSTAGMLWGRDGQSLIPFL